MYACYNNYYNYYYTEIILYMCVCVTTYTSYQEYIIPSIRNAVLEISFFGLNHVRA